MNEHEGSCCPSCIQDKEEGYADDLITDDICCCLGIKE